MVRSVCGVTSKVVPAPVSSPTGGLVSRLSPNPLPSFLTGRKVEALMGPDSEGEVFGFVWP